jgi:hypothetical protein
MEVYMQRLTWLDEKKDEIIKLHREDDWTNQQIADHLGTSASSINVRLRKWKANNSDGNRVNRVEIPKEDIRRMYWDEQMHPSQIAEIYGVCKQTITNKMKSYGIPFRTKSESRVGKLNPIYGVGHTEETRKKLSYSFVNGRKIGFSLGTWGNHHKYLTPNQGEVTMRSGWEAKVADYLTSKGLDWYYEYEWLKVGDIHYLPDFFIPDLNTYIEVKGRKKRCDMDKFEKARALYNIILWDGIELLKLGIIDNCGDAKLNRKYRKKN